MAKGAYIGVSDTPRKVKKIYIGVDGEPRRITKAYIGVGGVARPCWGLGGGKPTAYGAIDSLHSAAAPLAATVGDYAIFPRTSGMSGSATAYNRSLTKSIITASVSGESGIASTSTADGNYALFYGGAYGAMISTHDYMHYYNASLTGGSKITSAISCGFAAGATGDNRAVFAGGYNESYEFNETIELYTNSLTSSTQWMCDLLDHGYSNMSGVSCGSYGAWFAGGWHRSTSGHISFLSGDVIAIRSKNGDSYYVGGIDTPTESLAGTKVGNYALFGGGMTTSAYSKKVYAFSMSGTKVSGCADLSRKQYMGDLAVTTLGNYAIFAGAYDSSYSDNKIAELYDSSLTKQSNLHLSSTTAYAYSGVVITHGDFAIAAGRGSSGKLVDAITLV